MSEEFNPTRDQLERAKKTFLYLIHHDPDIQLAMKKVLRRGGRTVKGELLTRRQLCDRIRTGCRPLLYREQPTAFLTAEVYDAFKEYSRNDIRQMLIQNDIWIKDTVKTHPRSKTLVRAMILNIYDK